MTRKQRRLVLIGACGVVLAAAVVMMLYAIGDSKVFFQNPTDLVEKNIPAGTRIRIGGLVKEGSVQRGANLQVRFEVTDGKTSIPVHYQGILPDLFREGQGVVAEGKLEADKVVDADTVLAKHDERYMPKEVADALKKSGRWGEGEEAAAKGTAGAKTQ